MKKKTSILCIINVCFSALLIIISLFSQKIIDAATSHDTDKVVYYGIFLVVIILLEVTFKLVYQKLFYKYSLALEIDYKKEFYQKTISKKITEIQKYHTGELSNIYSQDIKNLVDFKTDIIPGVFLHVSRFLFAVVLLVYFDYRFFICLCILGLIAFVFAYVYIKRIKPLQRKALDSDGKVLSFSQESVENIKLIKAYNSENISLNRLDDMFKENKRIKNKRNNFIMIGNVGLFAVLNVSYILALIYGAYAISLSILSYGTLVALLQLVNHFESPFIQLSGMMSRYGAYKASCDRINNVYSLMDDYDQIEIKNFEYLAFNNVSFSYDKIIHKDLSFVINKNDKVFIQGPSGIGKTTIFNLLLGFIEPNNGSIELKANNELLSINASTRNLFAYVPQENILFSGTIRENINLLSPATDDEILDALKKTNLYDEVMAMPKKLDTVLHERGSGLSLGQIQRLMITIAFLKNREVLLLDEFSSALDKENEEKIISTIKSLDKTVIYITHRDMKIDDSKIISLEASYE